MNTEVLQIQLDANCEVIPQRKLNYNTNNVVNGMQSNQASKVLRWNWISNCLFTNHRILGAVISIRSWI